MRNPINSLDIRTRAISRFLGDLLMAFGTLACLVGTVYHDSTVTSVSLALATVGFLVVIYLNHTDTKDLA